MSEDHAVPPTRAEQQRLMRRVRYTIGSVLVAGVVALWLLIEFGGEKGEEFLGLLVLGVFAVWLLTWPYRKWKAWRGARRPAPRARAAPRR